MPLLNRQQALLTLLIALLSTTILFATNNGKNDINKYLLQEHLNYWVKDGARLNTEWDKAEHYYKQANSSYIADPDTLAYGSLLYQWATVLHSKDPNQVKLYINQIHDIHIEAIQSRPLWPYGWKELTTRLHQQNDYGEAFQESFKKTIQLGHQEDRIQVELSNIGLHQWSQLSVENRKLFIPFLRNSARKHAGRLIRLKHNNKTRLILCNGVTDNPVINKYCHKRSL